MTSWVDEEEKKKKERASDEIMMREKYSFGSRLFSHSAYIV